MSTTPSQTPMRDALLKHGLQPQDLRLLARALSCSEADPVFEERLRALAIQGLTELADWITGRKRHNTISESDVSRVLRIFLELRGEVPSLECLVDHFGIPEARSRSMLSRMNYGDARRMKALSYRLTAQALRDTLHSTRVESNRQAVTVDPQRLACITDAAWNIMSNPQDRERGGKYEGADKLDVPVKEKQGAIVVTSPKTWGYITTWLDAKAAEIEGGP